MLIKTLSEISKRDILVAGGKGSSLGEMLRAGIPVPPGFVVSSKAFDGFLHETGLNVEIESIMRKVNHRDVNSVEEASVEARDLIRDAEFPADIGKKILQGFSRLKAKNVAVRSSATAEDSSIASWAGELESYLNVTKKNLLYSVKKCWSSLFTPRAIFYRFEQGMHDQRVSVAVVVQKMIQSEVSGICFTVHPVTKDINQMIIESGYGLGEAIVGGKITPDTYVVHKLDKSILEINVSGQDVMIVKDAHGTKEVKVDESKRERQKLSDRRILELADICRKIEKLYKYPQDIEWAFARGRFYITQSRPITTL
jgi:pyruvate,water dikinase